MIFDFFNKLFYDGEVLTLIKQHYYTWTGHGLFRQDAGLDTVAISKGLQKEFVASVLHEHCFYDPPYKLNEYVTENKDQYPESQIYFRCESGEIVLGRTVFCPKSEQGEDTFFAHNFVFHSTKIKELFKHFKDSLYIDDFTEKHNGVLDLNLPELTRFRFESTSPASEKPESVLLKFGINERVFKLMLLTLMECIEKNRKMYVVLNVKTGKLFEAAREVLGYVLASLPYSFRKRIGYLTYAGKHTDVNNIHLYFLEKDYAGNVATSALNGYLFEFVSNEFKVADDNTDTVFLNYSWENLIEENQAFFDFIAMISVTETPNLQFLNEMAILRQLKGSDNYDLYKKNRLFAMQTINKYAEARNQFLKPTIGEIYLKIIEHEARDRRNTGEYFTEAAVMAEIAKYAEIVIDNESEEKAVTLCVDTIVEAREADHIDYINTFFTSRYPSERRR